MKNHPKNKKTTGPSRRQVLRTAGAGLATTSLAPLLRAAENGQSQQSLLQPYRRPHHRPKAKRVIYLFQSGGPSQIDLFDHKPVLQRRNGEQLPDSVRKGQRLTGMSGNQTSLPLAGSQFKFARHGKSGAWVSELLPETAKIVDKLCFVRSVHTEAINHDPAVTFIQTGSERAGRPSLGAWLSYGLGSSNSNLPECCVFITKDKGGQPLYQRLWGAGFLPTRHQGVQLRAGGDPVLYLSDPPGVDRSTRLRMLDALRQLHEGESTQAPSAADRILQYEMATRMQLSVPEVADLSDEPEETFALYGEDARRPGSFAANCLLARRLIERDVRCVQLFHQGWDQHGNLPGAIRTQCMETDKASAALVIDLERRGLLDDTLVVWGGEFGRTCYSQGKLTPTSYGRDHHPRCSTMWMAGGGVKPGLTYGETDDFSYNIVMDPVHVHDIQATMLHLLGIDHERLTFKHQGRRYRLTDIAGRVVTELLA
ncbi:MAG: hypothetical protein ACI8QS_000206 [Planctomycetota bacterium]|jgi:hypothetical protein